MPDLELPRHPVNDRALDEHCAKKLALRRDATRGRRRVVSISTSLRRRLSRLRPAAGLVLAHHRVGEPPGDREHELVPALSTRNFEERLELLAERYSVVSASQVLSAARVRRLRVSARASAIPLAPSSPPESR